MRQIKFRVMDLDGKWHYFTLGDFVCHTPIPAQLNPETWTQFTGLMDANGNEVYEGDVIAKAGDNRMTQVVTWDKRSNWRGMADGYNVHHVGFSISEYFLSISNFVAIGNIYQNPELLK